MKVTAGQDVSSTEQKNKKGKRALPFGQVADVNLVSEVASRQQATTLGDTSGRSVVRVAGTRVKDGGRDDGRGASSLRRRHRGRDSCRFCEGSGNGLGSASNSCGCCEMIRLRRVQRRSGDSCFGLAAGGGGDIRRVGGGGHIGCYRVLRRSGSCERFLLLSMLRQCRRRNGGGRFGHGFLRWVRRRTASSRWTVVKTRRVGQARLYVAPSADLTSS